MRHLPRCLGAWMLLGAFLLLPPGVEAQGEHTLTGTVTGPSGPVAGARVFVRVWDAFDFQNILAVLQATSGTGGAFSVRTPAGAVSVLVEPPEGSPLVTEVVHGFLVDQDLELRVELRREVTVSGRVPAAGFEGGARVELWSLTRNRRFSAEVTGRNFEARVPTDVYSVHAFPDCPIPVDPALGDPVPGCRTLGFSRANVDAASGSVSGVNLPAPSAGPVLPPPPRASLVAVSPADEDGRATVFGGPGAVAGLATVVAANLQTGQLSRTVSGADGSFSLDVFAPPGSTIEIKHDPTGLYLAQANVGAGGSDREAAPGALVQVPRPSPSATSFTGLTLGEHWLLRQNLAWDGFATIGSIDPAQLWVSGSLEPAVWVPGETATLGGDLKIFSQNLDGVDPAAVRVEGRVRLERLFDAEGRQTQSAPQFLSFVMTPTGFPLERPGGDIYLGGVWEGSPLRRAGERLEGTWELLVFVPETLPPGLYRPIMDFDLEGIPNHERHFGGFVHAEANSFVTGASLGRIRVGTPEAPRMTWVLGVGEAAGGSPGAVAVEDRGRFALADHTVTAGDAFIVPRLGADGRPRSYRLEPFVPLLSMSNGRVTGAPRIPLRFPSGSLEVTVEAPDGSRRVLGPAPFRQLASRTPLSPGGKPLGSRTNHPTDLLSLTTLDPRFEITFGLYGRHRIEVRGEVEDVWGHRYAGGGTYEIDVARRLDLETGVLPGTPFEVGDVFSPAVLVQPGVSAEVEVRLTLLPGSDPSRKVERVVKGRANRFGVFQPAPSPPLVLGEAGEYRADVTARYTGEDGVVWMGAASWGSVVETPGSPLVTRGRRGFDGVDAIQQPWFRVEEARTGWGHVMFPFHGGDVQWVDRDDPAAGVPKISVEDPRGGFAARVRESAPRYDFIFDSPSLEERILAGEIPLFSTHPEGASPTVLPGQTDQWGYAYHYAVRPGVRLREVVSEDWNTNTYWHPADGDASQPGSGVSGALPNDFFFHFGGAVYRRPGFDYYGAYASLGVVLPADDPEGGRISPPFRDAPGAASGGPLMTLLGEPVDLFFHPTGVRPGSILEVGGRASFPGQIGPTLPSRVVVTVTSPSSRVHRIAGRANKVGYFYRPQGDFLIEEAGVHRVRVTVVHDGDTSAGTVAEPFPRGGVLGAAGGEFEFYAVDRRAPELVLDLPAESRVRPAEEAIRVTAAQPPGLRDVELHATAAMPGFLLEQVSPGSRTYSYDAARLAEDFPNLDLFDAEGRAGADTVTLSFLMEGEGHGGEPVVLARQVLLQGEELLAPPQPGLEPCTPGPEVLCLLDDRFRVKVSWKDHRSGSSGTGKAISDSNKTGFFWFFDPANVELIVKILDARPLNGAFWLFYGALSDVGYTITVTDTFTGAVKTYQNPPGNLCGSGDVQAFPEGAVAAGSGEAGVPGAARTERREPRRAREARSSTARSGTRHAPDDRSFRSALSLARSSDASIGKGGPGELTPAPGAVGTCETGARNLCLLDRFRVEVRWRDHRSGNTGTGVAVRGTDKTGFFWFFDSENLELVVKMLDARDLTGTFWLFYGALSDVEYTITVTDTFNGTVKIYRNPPGNLCGDADTSAF